jgi:hypothetical protein
MAGILDKKTRFIDLVITQEGKRQIASGELKAEFASFTDMHAFYKKKQSIKDVTDRIYFEVAERPENSITLEKNDKGRVIQQDAVEGVTIVGENLFEEYEKDTDLETQRRSFTLATGSQFTSLSDRLTKLSINHLNKNYLLGTKKFQNDEGEFTLGQESISFSISNSIPFTLGPEREILNVDDLDSLIEDRKLANMPNFSFLPPVNEDGSNYGTYTDVRNTSEINFSQIIERLGLNAYSEIEKEEHESVNVKKNTAGDYKVYNREDASNFENFIKKEYETIKFLETSPENNIMIQAYEVNKSAESGGFTENTNKIIKLDIIDGGEHIITDDINNRNLKRVFYVGKIFFDSLDIPKFVNIFTIIFD